MFNQLAGIFNTQPLYTFTLQLYDPIKLPIYILFSLPFVVMVVARSRCCRRRRRLGVGTLGIVNSEMMMTTLFV